MHDSGAKCVHRPAGPPTGDSLDPMTSPSPLAVFHHHGPVENGPLVVLVHGSLDRATSFSRVVRRLPDLPIVTYDRRGYQNSRDALPLNETMDGHIDDLFSVIDNRTCVVVGHSYGGAIAIGAALRHPDGPIRAIGAYEPPLPWLPMWRRRPRNPVDRPSAEPSPAEQAEAFFRRMVGDAAWDRLSPASQEARRADGAALAKELAAIRSSEPPFDVTTLATPAVFGRGEASLGHHRECVRWLAEETLGAKLVEIPGASHGAHLSHPDSFAALVRDTLALAAERTSP